MKTALITGASAGIGKALAYQFAQQGFNLFLVARRQEALELIKLDLESRYSIQVETQIKDLAVTGQAAKLYEAVKPNHIDVWINNAGFGDYDLAWKADVGKVMNMVDLNVRALTDLSLRYIQDYVDQEAVLMNVSSVGGYAEIDVAIPYCATKFYASSFTEGVDFSLRTQGKKLRAKVLAPAGTQSEFHTVAAVGIVNANNEFELKDAIFPQVAWQRVVLPKRYCLNEKNKRQPCSYDVNDWQYKGLDL